MAEGRAGQGRAGKAAMCLFFLTSLVFIVSQQAGIDSSVVLGQRSATATATTGSSSSGQRCCRVARAAVEQRRRRQRTCLARRRPDASCGYPSRGTGGAPRRRGSMARMPDKRFPHAELPDDHDPARGAAPSSHYFEPLGVSWETGRQRGKRGRRYRAGAVFIVVGAAGYLRRTDIC